MNINQNTVNEIVDSKIKWEADLLFVFSFLIVNPYLGMIYGEKEYGEFLINTFMDLMNKEEIFNTIKDGVTEKIRGYLEKGYIENKECKTFKKHFEISIEEVTTICVKLMDFINFGISERENKEYVSLINEHFKKSKKGTIKLFHNWYVNNLMGTEKEKIYYDSLENALFAKGYSLSQIEHLKKTLKELFINKKKINKNDTTDFMLLNVIQNGNFLLTFDEQMIEAIEVGDVRNHDFILSFYKGE